MQEMNLPILFALLLHSYYRLLLTACHFKDYGIVLHNTPYVRNAWIRRQGLFINMSQRLVCLVQYQAKQNYFKGSLILQDKNNQSNTYIFLYRNNITALYLLAVQYNASNISLILHSQNPNVLKKYNSQITILRNCTKKNTLHVLIANSQFHHRSLYL